MQKTQTPSKTRAGRADEVFPVSCRPSRGRELVPSARTRLRNVPRSECASTHASRANPWRDPTEERSPEPSVWARTARLASSFPERPQPWLPATSHSLEPPSLDQVRLHGLKGLTTLLNRPLHIVRTTVSRLEDQ